MTFTYAQVQYILQNYVTLSRGVWPDPETVMDCRKPNLSFRAPFEDPCIMAGEVSSRLKFCGEDGMIVEEFYCFKSPHQVSFDYPGAFPARLHELSQERHMNAGKIRRAIHKVTWFCTDAEWFKELPYEEWKNQTHGNRKYREVTA